MCTLTSMYIAMYYQPSTVMKATCIYVRLYIVHVQSVTCMYSGTSESSVPDTLGTACPDM